MTAHPPEAPAHFPTDTKWRSRAACSSCPPELFFPSGSSEAALESAERAKRVCETCDVRTECLNFALDTRQEFGIWGGTDEKDRARIRPRQRVASLVSSLPV